MQVQEDPRRVAAPWCAPGEIEPEPISPFEAVATIYDALASDSPAYSKSADELWGYVLDAIFDDRAARLEMLRRCKDLAVVERMCEEIANDCPYGDEL